MKTLINIRNILLATMIVLGSWLAIPPQMFILPQYVVIKGYEVRVYRSFPSMPYLGRPWIRRIESVRDISIGRNTSPVICADVSEIIHFTANNPEYGTWSIEDWAAPCMRGDYVWSTIWTPYLFGIIPIRPVSLEYVHLKSVDDKTPVQGE